MGVLKVFLVFAFGSISRVDVFETIRVRDSITAELRSKIWLLPH